MSVFLVVLAFAFVAAGFYRGGSGLRRSFVSTTIPLSLFLVFTTETFSIFHAVTKPAFALSWAVFAVAAFFWMRRPLGDRPLRPEPRQTWNDLGKPGRWMLGGLTLVIGLVALTALLSAPNTWDAMEYHMPRVVEWIGNRGVQLYPTLDHQQLSMPPFSEYVILHLQLLAGSDRLANMVQWLGLAGCTVVASLVARELGASGRVQVLAAVVSGTIETGILGASGAKNDYILAYWVAVSVLLLLQWKKRRDWLLTLAIASALSLAVFSKGTGYAFLPPLVVVCFFLWDWKAQKVFLLRLPVLALVCVAVCGPLWARNHAFSGSILGLPYFDGAGPNEGRMYGSSHITPARSLANVIRSVGLNLAVPSAKVNALTVKAFSAAIRGLGVDPNDRTQLVLSQLGYLPPFAIEWHPFSETQSGNQMHFVLLAFTVVLCLWKRRRFEKDVVLLGCGVVCSFLLYATLLRWSPWNARYQLPVFVLGAVFSAIVLDRVSPRWTTAVASLFLLVAFGLAVKNSSRPLLARSNNILTSPRARTYFFDNHWFYADSFIAAARAAAGKDCDSIGIDANEMHFEYPMMALVNRDGRQRRLTYVAVHNSTVAFRPADATEPCTVVCLACARTHEKDQFVEQFKHMETYGDILVFSDPTRSIGKTASLGPMPQKMHSVRP